MQRSRLKSIINKSKGSQLIREPYDLFVNSLPSELDYYKDGGKYRLKAAWKAYGEPKNFQEAKFVGLVESLDGKSFVMPSIGYNEETQSYEYLNKGKENEIVNKDIRVWDNDVIPFIKELKLGGYVRTFNEEKDCWTYSKNTQTGELPIENNALQVIELFLKGGKSKRTMQQLIEYANERKPHFILRILNNDERTIPVGDLHGTHLLGYGEIDGKNIVYPEILDIDGNLLRLEFPKSIRTAYANDNYLEMTPEEAEEFTKEYKKYYPNYKPFQPQAFKQGGLMNVIPEGALHARKNGMELATEGEVTHKGIPVIDNDGELQAEIERNEIIFTKEVTEKIELAYKKFNSEETSNSEKDEIAIKIGKFLTKLIMENTDDKTGLILEVELKM